MIRTVYIAGPYTGPYQSDIDRNVVAALHVAESVSRLGLFPFVPHLYHFWARIHPHEYNFWMQQDAVWITKCDALYIYGESPGALEDVKIANQFGIPVFDSLQGLAKTVLEQSQHV